jgi:hypothetical protein
VLEAILPRALGRRIEPADSFQRARDRPDVRVQARPIRAMVALSGARLRPV